MFNHKKKTWTKLSTSPSNQNQPKKNVCFFLKFVSPWFFHQQKKDAPFHLPPDSYQLGSQLWALHRACKFGNANPGSVTKGTQLDHHMTPFVRVKIKNTYLSCHQPEIWNHMKLYVKYDCCFSYDKIFHHATLPWKEHLSKSRPEIRTFQGGRRVVAPLIMGFYG